MSEIVLKLKSKEIFLDIILVFVDQTCVYNYQLWRQGDYKIIGLSKMEGGAMLLARALAP